VQLAAFAVVLNSPAAHAPHTRFTVVEGVFDTKVPAVQVLHGVQDGELSSVENCALPQAVQLRSAMADPSLATYVPAMQVDIATQAVAGLPSWSQVPGSHGACGLAPPAQYSPALQAEQTVAEIAVPAVTCTMPAAQLPCGTQLDWLSPLENWPGAQVVHSRSAVAEGVLLTYEPALQVLHGVHAGVFCVALNCPVAQLLHTRSTVAEGVFDTLVPASQVVQATHAGALAAALNEPSAHGVHTRFVVGVPSAATQVPGEHMLTAAQAVAGLPSSSQVLDGQAVCGLVPPAQY
jgi:hypothetical protein